MAGGMKPVVQLDVTGCGIACVAALTGQTYLQARAIASRLGISVDDPALWSGTDCVRRMLLHCNIRLLPRRMPFRSWDALPDVALLAIKWHLELGKPFWHWVVFVREHGEAFVLDSRRALKTHRRTDFGRIKPRWYMKLVPVS